MFLPLKTKIYKTVCLCKKYTFTVEKYLFISKIFKIKSESINSKLHEPYSSVANVSILKLCTNIYFNKNPYPSDDGKHICLEYLSHR